MIIRLIILSIMAMATLPSNALPLTIEDYCSPEAPKPQSLKGLTPLSDGETYAIISKDHQSIDIYSFKTGKKTGELFSIAGQKGELKIQEFDGFELSANGAKLLLWNNKNKIYRRSFTAEYYVYDMMRSTVKRVSEKGAQRCATISHDGRFVAYVRDNNIFISSLDYGTDNQITKDGERNCIINGAPDWSYEEEFYLDNSLCWSGDDNVLAFLKFNEREVPEYSFDHYRNFCERDPLGDLYPSSYSYKYPLAGFSTSKVSVHAYDLDNRVIKKMDLPISESDYVPYINFAGSDGNRLMVMVVNGDQNQMRMFNVNPLSTVGKLILTETSEAWLSPKTYKMIDFDKNGFIIASERSGYRHLYQYDYSGALRRQLTKGNFNVTAYYGSNSVTGIHYFQSTSLGAINRDISSVDVKGVISVLNKEEGTSSAWFSKSCNYYIRNYSSAVKAPQYRIYNSKGLKIHDLELNEVYMQKYATAPKMEFLKVKNAVGEEMDAYIIKPLDFDSNKKYPLLMYQYNGPDSQQVENRWRMDGLNYIASKGYVVACVDGRGTGNKSREWAFAVYKKLGIVECSDQLAAAEYFSSLPFVDSNRTACFGWSYGGFMTLMELSDPACKFKAGISMAGVTDWRFYDAVYTERYMLSPGQNASGYAESSALGRSRNLKANLLLMSGTSDDNVHYYNTLKYASKLNFEGKLFDMMSFTGFEHSLGMCNARVQLYRKVLDFLDKNL